MVAAVGPGMQGSSTRARRRRSGAGSPPRKTVTRRPGFDWDGRIGMGPGVRVFVHDAYVAGAGLVHAALLGLVPLADSPRLHPRRLQGELLRFLAEAAWYPTALLPSQGVRWEALDGLSARATLTDGATTVALDVHFDAVGLISRRRAAARYRIVNGVLVATPGTAGSGPTPCATGCIFRWRGNSAMDCLRVCGHTGVDRLWHG